MAKIAIWIVVIFAVLFGLRLLNIAKAKQRRDGSDRGSGKPPAAETMVRCARCGVYLPSADASKGAEGVVCGEPGCVQRQRADS